MMKSYDEEAKRHDAFRECGVGATAQRTAWSIPSEPTGQKAATIRCLPSSCVRVTALRSGVVPFGATVRGVFKRNVSGTAESFVPSHSRMRLWGVFCFPPRKFIRKNQSKKGEHKNGKRLQKHTEYADNVV